MMRRAYSLLLASLVTLGMTHQTAAGFTINLDYSADTATDNFFNLRPAARAAIQAAANDINAVLSSANLSAVSSVGTPNATDITGTYGSTSVSASWEYSLMDPSAGATMSITAPSVAARSVTIFVGMDKLTGSTLGIGTPGGAGVGFGLSGFESELGNATNAMQTLSNSYMGRGSGPTIGTLAGSLDLGGAVTADYSLGYGAAYGAISFDQDTNNDGANDTLAQLDAFWNYDPTLPVAAGKNDLYSVALHEMLHALGVGTSTTWSDQVSGTHWTGSRLAALNGGSGDGLITLDGDHLASGLMSVNIYSGLAQEVAMDPSLTVGTRKQLTAMDVAVLQDLNWSTATYVIAPAPEPGTLILCLTAGALFTRRRRRCDH